MSGCSKQAMMEKKITTPPQACYSSTVYRLPLVSKFIVTRDDDGSFDLNTTHRASKAIKELRIHDLYYYRNSTSKDDVSKFGGTINDK